MSGRNFKREKARDVEEKMEKINEEFEMREEGNGKEDLEAESRTVGRHLEKNSAEFLKAKLNFCQEVSEETVTIEEKCKRRCARWRNLRRKLTCRLYHPELIHWVSLGFIGLAAFCIIYSVAGSGFVPGSQLFNLIVLFIFGYIGGAVFSLVKLPSLLGMLLIGLLLRNIGFIHLKGVYVEIGATLREVALCIILIRARLGLDPKALKSLRLIILKLAFIPGIIEGIIIMIVTHFLLDLPWLWGALLGGVLAAVSPAVVIPCLISLQERNYGTGKGIPTLVVAAASIDNILAITVFGVFLNVIYSTDTGLIKQIVQGFLGIISGIFFGILWGFISHFVPHQRDGQVVLMRVMMTVGGGLMATIGSKVIGYQGAGPLGCLTAAFVASLGWRKQGYDNINNPVASVFRVIWLIFQPILFGLIGSEVDVSVLEMQTVGNGLLALVCSLLGRIIVTVFTAYGSVFNLKEKAFIALAWFPKATVQAALGPIALDIARRNGSSTDIMHGNKILVIAVLAIFITAPIGAILITILGPKFLTKEDEKSLKNQMQVEETGLESREEENNKI